MTKTERQDQHPGYGPVIFCVHKKITGLDSLRYNYNSLPGSVAYPAAVHECLATIQWKVERLALKMLCPQRKSFNALGTTRSTLFAEMFLGEKFVCIIG